MQKLNATDSLNTAILLLEDKRAMEWGLLKRQMHSIHESIKPLNLIKSAFKEVTTFPDIKTNIVDTTIGMTTGYIARKVLWTASRNPLVNVLGTILQIAITNVVTKHPDAIKSSGLSILKRIFSKHKNDSV